MPSVVSTEIEDVVLEIRSPAELRGVPERDTRLACEGAPDAWFTTDLPTREWAKSQCATCPARAVCLRLAMQGSEPFGVWGGLDERERRELERARVRPARTERDAAGRRRDDVHVSDVAVSDVAARVPA